MERLTIRTDNDINYSVKKDARGSYNIIDLTDIGEKDTLRRISIKLAAYEDTEMIPEDINNMHKNYLELQKNYQSTISELEKYKDLEKQGLLIKLPCKLGSTVYALNEYGDGTFENEIYKDEADIIGISKNIEGQLIYTIDCSDYLTEDFGVTAFTTKEAAEKELKRLNKLEVEQ